MPLVKAPSLATAVPPSLVPSANLHTDELDQLAWVALAEIPEYVPYGLFEPAQAYLDIALTAGPAGSTGGHPLGPPVEASITSVAPP